VSFPIAGLSDELRDLGQALGLLDGNGDFDPAWLNDPLGELASILSNADQREAFLRFLDIVAPPAVISGLPAGETWHPLLGNQPNGNLYLTVQDLSDGITVGTAGDFGSGAGPSIQARLRAQVALVKAGSTLALAGGSRTGPLVLNLRLDLHWPRGNGPGDHPIGLDAIVVRATIVPDPAHPAFRLQVVLEQLQLTEAPPIDKVLDAEDLGRDAPDLFAGLLKVVLAEAGADAAAIALARHFLGLFGLSESDDIPPFPFAELADGPVALQRWLASLIGAVDGVAPTAQAWLTHFAGLIGSGSPVQGPAAGPWSVQLVPIDGIGGFSLSLERNGRLARFGVLSSFGGSLGAGQPQLDIIASVAIADLPLNGTGAARVLPDAALRARLTGPAAAPLVDDATVRIGTLQTGVVWDGGLLRPSLELLDVHFGTTTYPKLDLTNLQSVADAAAAALSNLIEQHLGPGIGSRLAALAGIVPPTTAGAWSHHLNVPRLVADPAGAIGAYHREVLLDPINNWAFLFGDLAGLLGITSAPSGTGTADDPWRVPLAGSGGTLQLQLAAWNAQASADSAQPQQLRIGLRFGADPGNIHFSWTAELLAFDLPAAGSGPPAFIGAQTLRFRIQPAIDVTIASGVGITLDSAELLATWTPAAGFSWHGSVTDLAFQTDSAAFTLNALTFPPAGSFDIQHIDTTAAALGLGPDQLEAAISFLLTWVASQTSADLYVIASLAGLHSQLSGLPSNAPLIFDPAHPGRLFSDPLAAFRGWIERALAFVDAEGMPHALRLLTWVSALIAKALPPDVLGNANAIDNPPVNYGKNPALAPPSAPGLDALTGAGTFDSPWRFATHAQLWFEPAGPPVAWATGAATMANAAEDFVGLAQAIRLLGVLHPPLAAALGNMSLDDIAANLTALALHLSTSDGVVPADSQSPEIFGWDRGDSIANTHEHLPSDPGAITQLLARIDSFVDGTHPRLVLLIGPNFLDRHAWDALLASPSRAGTTDPNASFNLRTPGINPATVSLNDVTAVADYYIAELADDNSGDVTRIANQIDNIAQRLAVLQPGRSITLVAHSTAGLAARAYATAHQDRVRALITLAAPHMGAPLPFLTDLATGDGARIANALRETMPASTMRDALDHMVHAMDGYLPAANASTLPQPFSYPAASFNSGAPFDTGSVPVVALQAQLTDDPLAWMKTATAALATQVAASGRAFPTHLCVAALLPMDLPASTGNAIRTEAELRVTVLQIPLHDGEPAPAHPKGLRGEIRLSRPEGWLLTGPATGDTRVRDLALRIDLAPALTRVSLELHEAAWHGPTQPVVTTLDPIALHALGEVMRTLTDAQAPLIDALTALTIVVRNASGELGIAADAWTILQNDPLSLVGAHLPDAIASASGWLGITGPPAGPWTWQPPDSPLTLTITRQAPSGPYRIGVAAQAGGTFDLDLGTRLPLPALQIDAAIHAGIVTIRWSSTTGAVTIEAPPWLPSLTVFPPPSAATLAAALNDAWPRLLFSGALQLVLSTSAPGVRMDRIESFLRDTGGFVFGGLTGTKINDLLQRINQFAGLPAGPGLQLPGDIAISAAGGTAPTDPIRIDAVTTAPIAGVLGLDLGIRIDSLRHVTPAGTLTLTTPLTSDIWPHITVAFGASELGLSLVITPEGFSPIQILPTFGGLGDLVAPGAELLVQVLDAAVDSFGVHPAWLDALLTAATDLGIYDAGTKFKGADMRAMLDGSWFATFDTTRRASVASALADIVRLVPGLPGTVGTSGGLLTWTFTAAAPDQKLGFAAGWNETGPTLRVSAENIQPADAPLGGTAVISLGTTGLDAHLRVQVLLDSIGVASTPTFDVQLLTSPSVRFRARILPLAIGADDGPLVIQLSPDFAFNPTPDIPARLVTDWALPVVARVAVQAVQPEMSRHLWNGGPTVQQALQSAGILDGGGAVVVHLPDLFGMVTGFLSGASTTLDLPIGDLHVRLVNHGGRIGLGVSGKQSFNAGDLQLSLLLGAPSDWGPPAADGVTVLLIDTGGSSITFNLGLLLHGFGVGIAGASGDPLVNDTNIRIGAFNFYTFLDLETAGGLSVQHFGAGAEVARFGLPLGTVTGNATGSGSNPVASNLLRPGGGGGDNRAANPAVDLDVWFWDYPGMPTPPFQIRLNGESGVIVIGVHAGFGPIYIDQIGVGLTSTDLSLLIDGGVSIAGLTAQVDELTIDVPFAHIADPTRWGLDLKGLALGYSGPSVQIAGGLVKFTGPPIEYDGMLLIKVGTIGVIAVGAYAVVPGPDGYTSIAILGGVFIPVGIPPIINLTGLALGLGYNRRLIVPDDLNAIPSFPLIQALDRPEALANNPMQALVAFRNASPASRGAFWFAAGLRGTTFQVVNVTAILYVALDTGVEVGLLGVARMALPADDAALVNIELALKARFSSSEGLFSVQAQLTDHSWLLSPDCQLTGGFAYFMWFKKSQFLLTLGGYHPSFHPLPEYPAVPRLGYHWDLFGVIHLKGESYFALTNTCVMAGTRMEATYGPDWIQLWFTAYCDFLVSWDPFHYDAIVGVELGARFRIEICFFGCVHISVSVSLGAELHVDGPPLHGVVTVDLAIATVKVEFGDPARPKPPQLNWDQFTLQYLKATDPNALPVSVQVMTGLMPAEPPGGPVAPGTADQPWRLSAEWSFQSETRMPARGFFFQTRDARAEHQLPAEPFGLYDNLSSTYAFDIAPMYRTASEIGAVHGITIFPKADGVLVLDKTLFKVEPVVGQVSEATYHFFPDFKPPAAANTLPVLTGIRIYGIPALHGQSAVIPIAKLRDASNPRPLPFAKRTIDVISVLKAAGVVADTYSALSAASGSQALLNAYAKVLSGGTGLFAELRTDTGLPTPGLDPLALHSLETRRSSPPVLAPLSYGLSMNPVGQDAPTVPAAVDPQTPVPLLKPRLRGVMQQQVAPAMASSPVLKTTVTTLAGVAATPIPRISVSRDLQRASVIPGARLLLRTADTAPRPARVTRSVRSVRHAHLGAIVPRNVAAAMSNIEDAAIGNGAVIRSGVTHVWEVPANRVAALQINSDMPVRVTFLSSAATRIADAEYGNARQLNLQVPARCGMVAITGLGSAGGGAADKIAGGASGAVTGALAPPGSRPLVGWQVGTHVAQAGPSCLLARGASIVLSQLTGVSLGNQAMSLGMIALSEAMVDQVAIQTYLPPDIDVVGILLDAKAGAVIGPETVVVAADNATLGAVPIRVDSGDRTLFLYDVTHAPGAAAKDTVITVATAGEFHLAGTLGMRGTAKNWGAELNGGVLGHLVPDAPLSPGGQATVRFAVKEVS
jgi:hypothetical protein